jgi:hypothetical protein
MATAHGKSLIFKIDNSAGSLQQITGVSEVQGLPGSVATDDVTAAGDLGAKSVVGLPDVTFTASGPYDNTATTGSYTVFSGLVGLAATSSFEFSPAGTTAGLPKFSGECRVTEFTVDASVKSALKWKATCHVEGAVTTGTN